MPVPQNMHSHTLEHENFLLNCAAFYQKQGFRIVELHSFHGVVDTCMCDKKCSSPGKHPKAFNWRKEDNALQNMINTHQINKRSGGYDMDRKAITGYGVNLPEKHFVIDYDPKDPSAKESLTRLNAFLGCDIRELAGFVVQTGAVLDMERWEPGLRAIDSTKGRGFHAYFKWSDDDYKMVASMVKGFKGIDLRTHHNFVVGSGSRHMSGVFYDDVKGNPSTIKEAPAKLLELLKRPVIEPRETATFSNSNGKPELDELGEWLLCIDPDIDQNTWVAIVKSIRDNYGDAGYPIAREWSSCGAKFKAHDFDRVWRKPATNGSEAGLGTIYHHAQQGGWKRPEQTAEEIIEPEAQAMLDRWKQHAKQAAIMDAAFNKTPDPVAQIVEEIENDDEEESDPESFAECFKGTVLYKKSSEIAESLQFPMESIFKMSLATASYAVGMTCCTAYPPDLTGRSSPIPAGIYAVAVAPASSGKSSVINRLTKPIQNEIQVANGEIIKFSESHEMASDNFDLPLIENPSSKGTSEGLEGVAYRAGGHFGMFSAEQGGINQVLGLTDGTGRKANCDLVLSAFSGDFFKADLVTRKGYEGCPHAAIGVLAQPSLMETIAGESGDTGFFERFLFESEPSNLGRRIHKPQTFAPRASVSCDYANAISVLISHACVKYKDAVDRALNDSKTYVMPKFKELESLRQLRFSETMDRKMLDYKIELEPKLAGDNSRISELRRGFYGKAELFIRKIAATIHAIEYAAQGFLSGRGNPDFIPKLIDDHFVNIAIEAFRRQTIRFEKLISTSFKTEDDTREGDLIAYLSRFPEGIKRSSLTANLGKNKMFGSRKAVTETINKMIEKGDVLVHQADKSFVMLNHHKES